MKINQEFLNINGGKTSQLVFRLKNKLAGNRSFILLVKVLYRS